MKKLIQEGHVSGLRYENLPLSSELGYSQACNATILLVEIRDMRDLVMGAEKPRVPPSDAF